MLDTHEFQSEHIYSYGPMCVEKLANCCVLWFRFNFTYLNYTDCNNLQNFNSIFDCGTVVVVVLVSHFHWIYIQFKDVVRALQRFKTDVARNRMKDDQFANTRKVAAN